MIHRYERSIRIVYGLVDLVASYLALVLAYLVRFHSPLFIQYFPVNFGIPPITDYVNPGVFLALAVVWITVFRVNRLHVPRRWNSYLDLIISLSSSIIFATLILLGFSFFHREVMTQDITKTYSRAVVVIFIVLDILLIFLGRTLIFSILRALRRRGYNRHNVLIIGAGELGHRFFKTIREHPGLGIFVVGFLDDDNSQPVKENPGIPILGGLADVNRVVCEHQVQTIYVALPFDTYGRLFTFLSGIQDELVDIKLIPNLQHLMVLHAGVEDLDGIPIINLSSIPLLGWNSTIKRLVDIAISFTAIILLSPLFLAIATLIKLTSSGPVFFKQIRMGLDGKSFTMLKFRSMVIGAEDETGPVFAKDNDPRCTRIGRFLRVSCIDELPQLFNVLIGHMSLVGPRPERPPFVQEFRQTIPRYMLRHKVKSGITGWAQINGYRGNTSIRKRLELDMYYIENWSLGFDFRIILLTILRLNRGTL